VTCSSPCDDDALCAYFRGELRSERDQLTAETLEPLQPVTQRREL
jgi:hypothetical protein